MLKAYFDDSGTHETSDVIVMGGIISSEENWTKFEPAWRDKLTANGLDAMHMSHCSNGWGQFKGWSSELTERAVGEFSEIVQKTEGCMLASAVTRRDWNAAVSVSRLGDIFETPIDFLFNTCLRRALEAKRHSVEALEKVSVVFDARSQNLCFWEDLSSRYEMRWQGKLSGYSFCAMKEVLPLQAADMIAYEVFLHEIDRHRKGGFDPKPRQNMAALLAHLPMQGGRFTLENLLEYATKFYPN